MDFKLFAEIIGAYIPIVSALKTLINLPKGERERYRQVLSDNYQLIHTTLNMIILRLDDILRDRRPGSFLYQVQKLGDLQEWLETERKLRLCNSLRAGFSETYNMKTHLIGQIGVKDWDALLAKMSEILAQEKELADFISEQFSDLAAHAKSAVPGEQSENDVRYEVEGVRNKLKQEREQLLLQEVDLFNIV